MKDSTQPKVPRPLHSPRILRTCYAMSGTGIGPTPSLCRAHTGSVPPIVLGLRYAVSGTGIGYAATLRRPALNSRMAVAATRGGGTELGCGGTRH
eukprot:3932700-Rhodomonas_salina.1